MPEGSFGFPRLTELGPFVHSPSDTCPDEFIQREWYSDILNKRVTLGNLNKEDIKQVFEERYTQDHDELTERLRRTFGMYVGGRGQPLFMAQQSHPEGLKTEERIEWVNTNSRNEDVLRGYRNLQELNQQIANEMPFDPCIYRGLHGEIASYLKLQYKEKDELVYFTRAIEFWSFNINESTMFSTEGIGKGGEQVEDAVIIATKLRPEDLFELVKTELRMMPTRKSILINTDNFWVVE